MLVALAGCPAGVKHPDVPAAAPLTVEVGKPIAGVAAARDLVFAASGEPATIEARRGTAITWSHPLAGSAGVLAASSDLVFAAVAEHRIANGRTFEIRGEPAAAVIGLDVATGAERWTVTVDSTEWAIVTSLAPAPDGGAIVGGTYAGTLRVDRVGAQRGPAHVVGTAGGSDGFVARLARDGSVAWLARVGGPGADAVQGVAAAGDRIAIAGTFMAGADLQGQPLPAYDERSPLADAFAAELDLGGKRLWAATFGGPLDDAVAGVAIDGRGRVAIAATARDVVHVGSAQLAAHGAGDGLVVWLTPAGEKVATAVLGGNDFDGLRAIAAVGENVVVAGFFSGTIALGDKKLSAGGGDDSFVAELDGSGSVVTSWQLGGEGREEVAALAPVAGGFVAALAHTAAAHVDNDRLPSPADPMRGAALIVRGVR